MSDGSNLLAWLVRMSGPLAGMRYPIRESVTRVGRGAQNDIAIADSPTVSIGHFEIQKDGSGYKIVDLNSTNGTLVNGERVSEANLEAPCTIQLGADGPELTFLIENETVPQDVNQTLRAHLSSDRPSTDAPRSGEHEDLLAAAVARVRMSKHQGVGEGTVMMLREMLHTASHRTRRKFTKAIGALVVCLVGVMGYAIWQVNSLKAGKRVIDGRIHELESRLAKAGQNQTEANQLYDELSSYQDQARGLEKNFLYRVSMRNTNDPLEQDLRSLLAEFGAETYSIPPEFLEQVKRFVQQYQGPDRPHMINGLEHSRRAVEVMRGMFSEEHLPPDLAYIPVVESSLSGETSSAAGAAGLWQFTPATARAYGLKVEPGHDERLDVRKSTQAACRYIRELILDFGAGSSVMLALAAYNVGPTKVKQAIRQVSDPIKQRNFWYLYRVRALPEETRQYVPKVTAVLVIARNPGRFGF